MASRIDLMFFSYIFRGFVFIIILFQGSFAYQCHTFIPDAFIFSQFIPEKSGYFTIGQHETRPRADLPVSLLYDRSGMSVHPDRLFDIIFVGMGHLQKDTLGLVYRQELICPTF